MKTTKGQDMKARLEKLKELNAVQCTDGNWDYDPYMHGMANGLILALAVIEDIEPVYLDAPDEWLKDKPDLIIPVESISNETN